MGPGGITDAQDLPGCNTDYSATDREAHCHSGRSVSNESKGHTKITYVSKALATSAIYSLYLNDALSNFDANVERDLVTRQIHPALRALEKRAANEVPPYDSSKHPRRC